MPRTVRITRNEFLEDRQGRTFADVLNDPEQPFDDGDQTDPACHEAQYQTQDVDRIQDEAARTDGIQLKYQDVEQIEGVDDTTYEKGDDAGA